MTTVKVKASAEIQKALKEAQRLSNLNRKKLLASKKHVRNFVRSVVR